MNFEFAKLINPYLEKLNFDKALHIAQTELQKIPQTVFHEILDKSLIEQANGLVDWIDNFYTLATKKNTIEALYFELNEFDINTDCWYIDGFAFNNDGGLCIGDMDWLCNFTTDTHTETGAIFKIVGYEKLQYAFEYIELSNNDLQNARDWSEQIVIVRFMELMTNAHKTANTRQLNWGNIPIYFTEHAYDFIVKSENN